MLYGVMSGIDIANNVFYHNGNFASPPSCFRNYGIDTCLATGGGVQIRNNLFFANPSGNWNLCANTDNCGTPCSITTPPSGSVLTDPAFVDPYGDWHLRSGSGAIAQGVNLYSASPETDSDYDGNPRPSAGNYDIGAYVHP